MVLKFREENTESNLQDAKNFVLNATGVNLSLSTLSSAINKHFGTGRFSAEFQRRVTAPSPLPGSRRWRITSENHPTAPAMATPTMATPTMATPTKAVPTKMAPSLGQSRSLSLYPYRPPSISVVSYLM
jgi:hypothetical protein